MLPEDAAEESAPSLLATLGPALLLPRITIQQLFSLPGDALPRAVTRLCGLTQDDVIRLTEATTEVGLRQLLEHETATLYYYALVGWLAYDSPLGEAVRMQILGTGSEAAMQGLAKLEHLVAGVVPMLAEYVPTDTATTTEALEALFAQEKYGLTPALPALLPAAAKPFAADEDDDIWLHLENARPLDLNLFCMAMHLTHSASYGVPHPLGAALAGVAGLGPPAELVALARRIAAANAAGPPPYPDLALNGPDLIRLYLSLQVLALLFVADLQPALMSRINPDAYADTDAGPWFDPEQQQATLTWVCTQVEAFGLLFDDYFGEEPTYQTAKAEAQRLAALL